ncbi:MAG: aryl-alcohol dehydrogenase-like predicted oxidoreductase [Verrucomicrobiales bacterium]|jgi:aryl-alcohol dehydrogenase-like predicted oxidoreductase
MEFATLGKTGLRVSRIGIGCSHIASVGSSQPQAEIKATLRAAADAGINFFDTASVYGQGDSERMLGKLFGAERDNLILCTKAGLRLSVSQKLVRFAKPFLRWLARKRKSLRIAGQAARQASERQCFEPKFLQRELEASLKRLRTDRVDLFLLHSPPIGLAENEELATLLDRVVHAGKARFAGVSCANAADARRWLEIPRVSCVQVPFSIGSESIDVPVGAGVIAREVLAGRGAKTADEAIKHALTQPLIDVALVRVSSREHLESNLKVLS